jgi:hypothetical protein
MSLPRQSTIVELSGPLDAYHDCVKRTNDLSFVVGAAAGLSGYFGIKKIVKRRDLKGPFARVLVGGCMNFNFYGKTAEKNSDGLHHDAHGTLCRRSHMSASIRPTRPILFQNSHDASFSLRDIKLGDHAAKQTIPWYWISYPFE